MPKDRLSTSTTIKASWQFFLNNYTEQQISLDANFYYFQVQATEHVPVALLQTVNQPLVTDIAQSPASMPTPDGKDDHNPDAAPPSAGHNRHENEALKQQLTRYTKLNCFFLCCAHSDFSVCSYS
jgi:hypothetical protein